MQHSDLRMKKIIKRNGALKIYIIIHDKELFERIYVHDNIYEGYYSISIMQKKRPIKMRKSSIHFVIKLTHVWGPNWGPPETGCRKLTLVRQPIDLLVPYNSVMPPNLLMSFGSFLLYCVWWQSMYWRQIECNFLICIPCDFAIQVIRLHVGQHIAHCVMYKYCIYRG